MNETATLDPEPGTTDAVSILTEEYLRAEVGGNNVPDVVRLAHLLWHMVRGTWGPFQLRLDEGMEAGRARHAAASAALACDSFVRVVSQLEAAATHESSGAVEGLPELIAAAAEARTIRKAARRLIEVLDAPEPPLDDPRLTEGLSEAGRGAFESTEAMLQRLRAGGEL